MNMPADQGVHLRHLDPVGGEHEFQFRHIGVQRRQADAPLGQRQLGPEGLFPPVTDHVAVVLPAPGAQFLFQVEIEVGGLGKGLSKALVGGLLKQVVQQGAGRGAAREGVDAVRPWRLVHVRRVAVLVVLFRQLIAARIRRGQGFLNLFQRAVAGDPPGLPLPGRKPQLVAERHGLFRGPVDLQVAVRRGHHGDGVAGQRCQRRHQAVVGDAAAEQQTPHGAAFQVVLFAAPLDVGRQAQGAGVAGAGQRHIEQAHVLGQPLVVGLVLDAVVRLQGHIEVVVFVVAQRRLVLVRRAEAADKGQVHQRVFQALGLVDGDHLDPVVVAFQAQDALLAAGALLFHGALHRVFQIADQRLLAVQAGGGLLQQLGQVQQVGQGALAVQALAEPGGHLELHQQAAQHWQHALGAPLVAVAVELLHGLFPAHLVLVERVQLRVGQVEHRAGQGAAHPAVGFRRRAGVQNQQQVEGFRLGEHGILIGQINAAHLAFHQRVAHRLGLNAVAHQDGDVVGVQRGEAVAVAEAGDALFRAVEQVGDVVGAAGRLLFAIGAGAHRFVPVLHPQGDAGLGRTVHQQLFLAPLGFHRLEGDGVVHHEDIAERLLTVGEQMVHRLHHGLGGAEVLVQGVVVAFGGAARFQIGEDVGAPEGVDRLLGVADHKPAGALVSQVRLAAPVQRRENPVLGGVGVLEFVDQRHRELGADHLGEPLAVVAVQGIVQAAEHVVEADGGGLAAHLVHPLMNPGGGVGEQIRARQAGVGAPFHDRVQGLAESEVRSVGLARLGELHAVVGKLRQRLVALVVQSLAVGVTLQGLQHARQAVSAVAVAVEPFVVARGAHPFQKVRQFGGQLLPRPLLRVRLRAGEREPVAHALRQHVRVRFAQAQQRAAGGQQGVRVAQVVALQGIGGADREIGDHGAPVIAGGLLLLVAGVLLQFQAEQAAGIEGVLLEHAVAEAVDGVDGGFVHPLRGGLQTLGAAGALLGFAVIVEQLGEHRVAGFGVRVGEQAGGFGEAVADTLAQFLGGRFGEGHHQDFRRQQRPVEGVVVVPVVAVAQHQAQVEGGQGKGLAGAGAGLDQPGAVQREGDRQRSFSVHAGSPGSCHWACAYSGA